MMNDTGSANANLAEYRGCLQVGLSDQNRLYQTGQTFSHSRLIHKPVSERSHFGLEFSAASDPNAVSLKFNSVFEARCLRGSLDAYVKTCQRWKLSPREQIVLLGYDPCDAIGGHVLSGNYTPASKDFRDRIAYVLCISLGLGSLFNEAVEPELEWLGKPRAELGSRSAFDCLLEGSMSNLFVVADLVERERGL